MNRSRVFAITVAMLTLPLVGCGSGDGGDSGSAEGSSGSTQPGATARQETGDELSGTLTVSAAASLNDAFKKVIEAFEEENPDADIRANYGSSSTLAEQIRAGAPADVAAFANKSTMQELVDAGLVEGPPQVFVTNEMAVVTKAGNPDDIQSVEDLKTLDVVALCGKEVPCGRYAAQLLDNLGVTLDESHITRGQNATATLTAVTEGDARAAILYGSDAVRGGDRVEVVTPPPGASPLAEYPIAVLADSQEPELADAFVAYLGSEPAQGLLEAAGFGVP